MAIELYFQIMMPGTLTVVTEVGLVVDQLTGAHHTKAGRFEDFSYFNHSALYILDN